MKNLRKSLLIIFAIVAFGPTAWAQNNYIECSWDAENKTVVQTPSYTFEAKTDDYASRFKLVFSAQDSENEADDHFAFISNGEIIINGTGTLQVIDVTGRVLATYNANSHISTESLAAGVYVLRLINGDNVRTQKIVVK
jgi:hypothetical protein